MSVQSVLNRYDPENDAAPVSWADAELAFAIEKLQERIRSLEDKLSRAESVAAAAGESIE